MVQKDNARDVIAELVARFAEQIDSYKSRIDYYEDKINLAVYQLYGLTEEEIKIVEGLIKK